ncbi:MAG TPA: DUF2270 domain-containing protein [Thermoanaerobaculia bacterium]|nr:DUF2270 domain-containing protein [Thermoanaerobaculia bacterium]
MQPEERRSLAAAADFEHVPLTRGEYIAALVHLYRGQLTRADAWRARLDTTSNWAVVTTMGLLSFAFSSAANSHASILVGMVLITHFLLVEARRYRVFDVWNSRVRMIEENFYGPILTRDLASPRETWGTLVAEDLLHPCFKITYLQALRARLVRNYSALYLLLVFAWATKVLGSAAESGWRAAMAVGPIRWPLVLLTVAALYAFLAVVALVVERVHPPESEIWKPQRRVEEHF